MSIAKLKN